MRTLDVYCDGGMLGPRNPSPEGVRWSVWVDPPGAVVLRGETGTHHTNNDAEYLALKAALGYARGHGGKEPDTTVMIYMDSLYVVNTFSDRWKIHDERLWRLKGECRTKAQDMKVILTWVPRLELVRRVGH